MAPDSGAPQPADTLRIALSYQRTIRRLKRKARQLTTEWERLKSLVQFHEQLCVIIQSDCPNLYPLGLAVLTGSKTKLTTKENRLKFVKRRINQVKTIHKRRLSIQREQNGIFPLCNITSRAEFNQNR